jgi:hypothetical protein
MLPAWIAVVQLFLNFHYRQEFGVSGTERILDVTPKIMRITIVKSLFDGMPLRQRVGSTGRHQGHKVQRLARLGLGLGLAGYADFSSACLSY